ncbi:flavin-containing monooxygenase [Demequina mangrovi]|uniref:Predicted flavoprotein CzcO associated with the cation diffusion facilitator CzcD n=1 Tax=Demequina mangrovi TaxID=1043493 RepID=A0A1H6TZU0_9MICO|nr:NAD(P)-binding domain-containing protein [Demequina mangrovi]SEI81720.1 Predicted flavoprotein CzcO associated with the cation diffusion facilitator CzcD [Demequina mangrovi]
MRDTAIIGAGPAGLAAAHALKQRGLPYTHLERNAGVGGLWDIDAPGSPMYESAHFISSKTLSAFPGFPMPDDYPDYPSHRQILAYLRGFAEANQLIDGIELGTAVERVERIPDGYRVTRADGRATDHAQVIVASGVQWIPQIIDIPGDYSGEIRHTVTYRSAAELEGRRVLIVGGGNSGADIACDAARSADRAAISLRRGYHFIPKHVFGMPSDVFSTRGPTMPIWLEQRVFGALLRLINGDVTRLGLPRPDHKVFETHPLMNSQLLHHLGQGDITARPGIAATEGTTVTFTDGSTEDVDLILLATGYRHEVPYARELLGEGPHPDLYLTAFARHPGLYGLGFVETNGAAYVVMAQLAAMIAQHIEDRTARPDSWDEFERIIATDEPDLSRGIRFIDSPRHTGYVEMTAITRYLHRTARRMSWSLP